MKRKTFINRLTLGSGGAILLPSANLLQSCGYDPEVRSTLSKTDIPLLNELAETILPATGEVPGAKGAEVGEYILLMYSDCMTVEDQAIFLSGLNEIDARAAQTFSNSFLEANGSQKLQLLAKIQSEAIAHNLEQEGAEEPISHYFDILKGLTISGYFTSEIGMTEARNYLPVPGKFEACIPYNKGDRPWAI